MEKFKGKYRIPSTRLQTWDYGSNGLYFITICTQNHEHYFGEICNGQMRLSEIGILAQKYWNEIPEHFPFVNLDEFVVMPNHIHGIIEIAKSVSVETPKLGVSAGTVADTNTGAVTETPNLGVSTGKWKPATIGVIINQYKRIVTINSRKINIDFKWQTRFHDHIIRDDADYQRIKNYIINNPKNWKEDILNE